MNRHLLALAALCALSGTAVAQSTVTVYGVLDTNLGMGTGSVSDNKQVGTGGLAGSRLGFRGTEDLGGGLKANFLIEHGLNSDNGTQASPAAFWNRLSYVGLAGGWGELQLGRVYTPTFLVHATYDAFGPQGVAAQQVLFGSMEIAQPANIRANNAVNYLTPAGLGGFMANAQVSAGEGAPGKYTGVSAGYQGGGFAGHVALGRYDNPAIDDLSSLTVGARYKFGDFTLYGLYDRANSGNSLDTHGLQVSGMYAIGALELKASYAQASRETPAGVDAGTSKRTGIGAVYHLSKRTALYGSYARIGNSDGANAALNGAVTAANQGSTGLDLGIRHAF
ncbi:MAG: porin [Vitreoscilla sp.]|nr:porin [Vitreoscilla sp.]